MRGYGLHISFMLLGVTAGALVVVLTVAMLASPPSDPSPEGLIRLLAGEWFEGMLLKTILLAAWAGACIGLGGVFGWKAGAHFSERRLQKWLEREDG